MTVVRVDSARRMISGAGLEFPCEIGRAGTIPAADKREGDGRTPLGRWPMLAALFRRDRVAVPAGIVLPWRWIDPADGWSDDPADPAYNRPVTHPHRWSAEHLWRDDGAYDVIVVLGHNWMPPAPAMGSAVFLHCFEGRPTAGCVAAGRDALLDLLARLAASAVLEIS